MTDILVYKASSGLEAIWKQGKRGKIIIRSNLYGSAVYRVCDSDGRQYFGTSDQQLALKKYQELFNENLQ